MYLDENTHVHINTVGNGKLGKGIWNISLLPGSDPIKGKDGQPLTNIGGTCKGCCKDCEKDCYAIKYTKRYHNTCIPAYEDNTILAVHFPDTFFSEINEAINRSVVSVVRFHVAGEIPNAKYFKGLIKLCNDNPRVQFYLYTKRYKVIEKYYDLIPTNLTVNLSIWHKNYANPHNLPTFEYDDGVDPSLKDVFHCPATDKRGHETGITCASCKRCIYAKPGTRTAVYAH